MVQLVNAILLWFFKAACILCVPIFILAAVFALLCLSWFLIFKFYFKFDYVPSGRVKLKSHGIVHQLLFDVPRQYVSDLYTRDPDAFGYRGIHMFCGEQGCGKTIASVEMMIRMQKEYPKAKTITNFGLATENDELTEWQQLLDYTNEHRGVIVGIDEIQNWFMSGRNQLPPEMLEVATQNRKNRRCICCTAQIFTRVNKGIREQVTMLYEPHTFLGCFTIVVKRKPLLDSEGNVLERKYRGMYAFVHTPELRDAYDTYKVIHTLAQEGFKQAQPDTITNFYIQQPKKRR